MDRFGSVATRVASECMQAIAAEPRTPAIVRSTDRLRVITDNLMNVIDALECKCIALLGPQPLSNPCGDCKMEGPPLACCIHESCDRLDAAHERLRVLLDRIEL